MLGAQVTTPCDMLAEAIAVEWAILGTAHSFRVLVLLWSGMGSPQTLLWVLRSQSLQVGLIFSLYWNYYCDVNFIAFLWEEYTFQLVKADKDLQVDGYEVASSMRAVGGILPNGPKMTVQFWQKWEWTRGKGGREAKLEMISACIA